MPNGGTGSAFDPPTYHATTERENKTAQLRRGDTQNLCRTTFKQQPMYNQGLIDPL